MNDIHSINAIRNHEPLKVDPKKNPLINRNRLWAKEVSGSIKEFKTVIGNVTTNQNIYKSANRFIYRNRACLSWHPLKKKKELVIKKKGTATRAKTSITISLDNPFKGSACIATTIIEAIIFIRSKEL